MDCQMKKDVLERWVDDELHGEPAESVEAHVKDCGECHQHIEQTLQVRTALRESTALQVSQAPLDTLWSRIEQKLDQTEATRKPVQTENHPFSIRHWWHRLFRPIAIGTAVAALGITLALWAIQTPLSPSNQSINTETVNHAFVMESYEVSNGTVIIDVDPMGAEPAVVWHFIEEEEERI